jgi:chromosomal replication initiation ATPase DnaA
MTLSIDELSKTIEETRSNLRKLEKFRAELTGRPIEIIDVVSEEKRKEFDELLDSTRSGRELIISRSRKVLVAIERHLVCWIAKKELDMHESSIAYLLGNRERTTMFNSFEAAEMLIEHPGKYSHYLEKLLIRVHKFKENARHIEVLKQ